jgi:hypothetical protein
MKSLADERICRNILVATINEGSEKKLITFCNNKVDNAINLALERVENPIPHPNLLFEFRYADADVTAALRYNGDGVDLAVVIAYPKNNSENRSVAVGKLTTNPRSKRSAALVLECEEFVYVRPTPLQLSAMKDEVPNGYSLIAH